MILKKGVKRFIMFCIFINIFIIAVLGVGVYSYSKNVNEPYVVEVKMRDPLDAMDDCDFVNIKDVIPDIAVELLYATDKNITGKVLYCNNEAYLRLGTAKKLKKANDELLKQGYSIKIWDAYRPMEVQYKLWEKVHDARYIVNPSRGSIHNRGAAVDITVIDKNDNELSMPTGFDSFSNKCDRDYSDVPKKEAMNAMLLEKVMTECGFIGAKTEWWHFSDSDWSKYPIVDKLSIDKDNNFKIEVATGEDKTISSFENLREIDLKGVLTSIRYEFSKIHMLFNEYMSEE